MSRHSPNDPLGFDAYLREDITALGRSATGLELTDNEIYHRITTDTLLMTGTPDGFIEFGEDVRKWVGEAMTDGTAALKAARLVIIINRSKRLDPGATRVEITTTRTGDKHAFRIRVAARTTTNLPIDRIYGVTSVSVETLAQGS